MVRKPRSCTWISTRARAMPVTSRLRPRGGCGKWSFRPCPFRGRLHPCQLLQTVRDGREVLGAAKYDEDGIVAGDGADDLGPLLPVDGGGDGLGPPGERL